MDIAREKRVLRLFEEALEWPKSARTERLTALLSDEPEVLRAVLAMLRADDSSILLPTIPPEPIGIEEAAPTPERIGKYRILEEIGRGGMGLVYRGARDDGLFEQEVAIKVIRRNLLSATMQEQFANERRILARLHHPNIAHLLDGGVSEDGASYIIMELIHGTPITEYADTHALDLAARLALFDDVCAALDYAHRQLVVHADVKPSNVVVADGLGVKLLDFGIARLVGEDGARLSTAHTPGYSSPSQQSGECSTPADDVFALGVLLHNLIDPVAGADEDLRAIAAMAAAPVAEDRYRSVAELSADLARWRKDKPVLARTPDRRRIMLLFWRRNRVPVVGAILLTLFATAMTVLFIQASIARDAAQQRFTETRNLSNYLVSDVVTELETMPGTGPIRRLIAERARGALEKLRNVPGAPVDLQIETANAYARVGAIMAAEDLREVMDPATGDAVLSQAEADLRALRRTLPDRADLRLSLAHTLFARALFAGEAKIDQKRTFAILDEINALLKPILAKDPGNFPARMLLVRSHLLRADSYSIETHYAAAIVMADAALDLLMATRPETPRQRADHALSVEQAHTLIGDATWYGGDPEAALVAYKAGRAAIMDAPLSNDIRVLKRRAYTSFTVASTLFGLGRTNEALAMSEAGLAEIERLRGFDDSVNVRRMENIVREEYSYELQATGRKAEAYRQNDGAIAGYRENARLQPNNYQVLRALPVALRPSGEMYRDNGDLIKACVRFREADAIWTKLARENRVSAFDLGNDVKLIKANLADCDKM